MEDQIEESTDIKEKFEKSIHWVTLIFHDSQIEAKYRKHKSETLVITPVFKFGLVALVFILICRRLELLFFTIFHLESIAPSPQSEYIQTSITGATLILESLFLCFDCLKWFKGFVLMVYMFFTVYYSSIMYLPSKPSAVPMHFFCNLIHRGMPIYVGAIIVGVLYVYIWLAAGLAAIAGLGMSIYFNHLYKFPICIFLFLSN